MIDKQEGTLKDLLVFPVTPKEKKLENFSPLTGQFNFLTCPKVEIEEFI